MVWDFVPIGIRFVRFFVGFVSLNLCCYMMSWMNEYYYNAVLALFRHQSKRLLQEHGMGSAGGQGQEESQTLSVLFRTLSRHQV